MYNKLKPFWFMVFRLEDQRRQSGEDNSDRERELLEEIESAKVCLLNLIPL